MFKAYQKIIAMTGNGEYDFSRMPSDEIKEKVKVIFDGLGYNTDILFFDSSKEGHTFDKQPMYQLCYILMKETNQIQAMIV